MNIPHNHHMHCKVYECGNAESTRVYMLYCTWTEQCAAFFINQQVHFMKYIPHQFAVVKIDTRVYYIAWWPKWMHQILTIANDLLMFVTATQKISILCTYGTTKNGTQSYLIK